MRCWRLRCNAGLTWTTRSRRSSRTWARLASNDASMRLSVSWVVLDTSSADDELSPECCEAHASKGERASDRDPRVRGQRDGPAAQSP